VQKNEGVDCAIGGRTGTFCKDRAGHALLSDCSTNERSAFVAVPLPFRGDEDRIGGSAILETQATVVGAKPGLRRAVVAQPEVYLILLVLWKNGSGCVACTSIDPKLGRCIRGWPSDPQKKKRSTKRSTPHPLVPTSAFVSIRDIRSVRFSTAPDLSFQARACNTLAFKAVACLATHRPRARRPTP